MKTPRPVKRKPYFWAGIVLAFGGAVLGLMGLWPVMLVCWLGAILIDRPRWICPFCGNRLEKTSRVCPACSEEMG